MKSHGTSILRKNQIIINHKRKNLIVSIGVQECHTGMRACSMADLIQLSPAGGGGVVEVF